MTQYYECHITLEGNKAELESAVAEVGWKFSAIDGDPVLGDGVKCYATKHFNSKWSHHYVVGQVDKTARDLRRRGHNVTREKVELVIYDTRTKSVKPDELS